MKSVFMVVALCCLAVTASAKSKKTFELGYPVYFDQCGGKAETRVSKATGDLSVDFSGVDTISCDKFTISDSLTGHIIKEYSARNGSFTLAKSVLSSLGNNCSVDMTVSGYRGYEVFQLNLGALCAPAPIVRLNSSAAYQLSKEGNCKVMNFNAFSNKLSYTNKLTTSNFCTGAISRYDVVNYEWSEKGNCKRMVNEIYTHQNVSDSYCLAN